MHPDQLNPTCSIIREARDTETMPIAFRDALSGIRTGRWADKVNAVRAAYAHGGKDEAAKPKKLLPGVLFSGTFSRRSSEALLKHSGLLCADLDGLGDAVETWFEQITADPHTLACFRSPTGSGLKVVFRVDPLRPHIDSFHAAEHYMLEHFGLAIDEKCSDVSRICFVSHDRELFEADDATPLPYPPPRVEVFDDFEIATPGDQRPHTDLSPGDDFNLRGAGLVPDLLRSHGWTHLRGKYWCRPGKTGDVSASWEHYPNTLHVFSSAPETGLPTDQKGFDPFAIYTHLEHGGDWRAAVRALGQKGYGTPAKAQKTRQEITFERVSGEPQKTEGPTKPAPLTVRPITSYAYPSDDDPNMLLGSEDYLGRGGGLLFVSHAGAGKSSWAMDACMMWALGRAWMQIKAHQPRKTLIVQAEDSDRYIGKIFASFAHVNKLTPDDLGLLTANCVIIRLKGVSGQSFFTALAALVAEHNPDLVVINPIYLYAEGDITRSEYAQPFLLGLDAVNRGEKFAYILIHHTGKPQAKGNNGKRAEVEDWESAYMGFGSSYLANWPRATILLEPVAGQPGRYQIKLGKGGFNAGVTKEVPHGVGTRQETVTRIAVRHSTDRMLVGGKERPVFYWEVDTDTPAAETVESKAKRGRPAIDPTHILQFIPKGREKALPAGQIFRLTNGATGLTDRGFAKALFNASRDSLVSLIDVPGKGPCYHM
jgi:hypothetical protein